MRFPIATTLCLDYLYYELHALMMYYLRPSCVLTAIACAEQKETKISHKLTLTFPRLTHIYKMLLIMKLQSQLQSLKLLVENMDNNLFIS